VQHKFVVLIFLREIMIFAIKRFVIITIPL